MTARLRRRAARLHPSLDPDRWYDVVRQEQRGAILDLGTREQFVSWTDLETRGGDTP